MTAKEKAKDLILKYIDIMPILSNQTVNLIKSHAKECALIAVDELINEQTMWQNGQIDPVKYWQEVKSEIEKL